ncbi:MAG TPA: RNA polymerase sigma factor [Solirubrobacterales bacterium]|nr:RNA polymerase sigma factor [Solirubrobacterales bacterium]
MDARSHDGEAIAASLRTPASFAAIFDRHYDVLHGYLQRQAGADVADEVASQTFLVAFDRRGRFDLTRASARPWLFGIAVNLLRHHYRGVRRQLRAYERTGVDPVADAFDGLEARVDAAAMGRALAAALARLSVEEREVLLLYAWADLTYTEIAETLGLPVGTVRSCLHRARGRVRELLEGDRASTGAAPRPVRGEEQWTRSS